MEVTQAIEGVPKLALLAHEGILYQVEKQDGGKAEACMRKHLMSADENLRRVFADKHKSVVKQLKKPQNQKRFF